MDRVLSVFLHVEKHVAVVFPDVALRGCVWNRSVFKWRLHPLRVLELVNQKDRK